MKLMRIRVGALALLAVTALVACAGGGGGSSLPGVPASTPTPAALPAPSSAQSNASIPVSTTASSVALPSTSGITATLSLPPSNSATSIAATVATGSATATLARLRAASADPTTPLPGGPYMIEIALVAQNTVTLAGAPGASFDLTSLLGGDAQKAAALLAAANVQFFAGIEDTTGAFAAVGPLSVNGTVVTYGGSTKAVTLQGGVKYRIGIHIGSIATPAPTATPLSAIVFNPSSLALAPLSSANFTASAAGYTGVYHARLSDADYAGGNGCIVAGVTVTNPPGQTVDTPDGKFQLIARNLDCTHVTVTTDDGRTGTLSVSAPPATPSPTPSPTPAAFALSTSSISFPDPKTGNAAVAVTITGIGDPNEWFSVSSDGASAIVDAQSVNASNPVFHVSPGSAAGTAHVTVTDPYNHSATITVVTTTTTTGVIQ